MDIVEIMTVMLNIAVENGCICHKKYIYFVTNMDNKCSDKDLLEKAIRAIPKGTVFSSRDLRVSIADDSLRQNLKRLVDGGAIRRVRRGFFERPQYSKFLHEKLDTDTLKMAEGIARNNNWTIAPTGNTALNILGLSTQVPARWTFVSDGPYKKYDIGGKSLEFKHRANRDISGHSSKTNLVIQALKSLPAEQLTDDVVEKISGLLTDAEKRALLKESVLASRRILKSIYKICGADHV